MIGTDVEITEVHQRVRDGVLISFDALNRKYLSIAGLRATQVPGECADIAEIAERIGEGSIIFRQAIIRDCLFVGRSGLSQLAAMKKDTPAMFMIVRHDSALVGRREVCYGALRDGSDKLPTMRPRIYLPLLRWAGMYAMSALWARRIRPRTRTRQ